MDPYGNCKIEGVLFHKENFILKIAFFGRPLRIKVMNANPLSFSGLHRIVISS